LPNDLQFTFSGLVLSNVVTVTFKQLTASSSKVKKVFFRATNIMGNIEFTDLNGKYLSDVDKIAEPRKVINQV
jgi:ribosomal protein S3AE